MQVHEVCSIFPMMSDEEFAGLKADIAANGQREPIWTHKGKVVDGRNRLKACEELGRKPRVCEWNGIGSLVEFVVSLNLHRRHLSSGQLAMCADEAKERIAKEIAEEESARKTTRQLVAESPKEAPRSARKEAADMFGTNHQYVTDAGRIRQHSPELAEKVKAGTITLPQAKREVTRAAKRADMEAKAQGVDKIAATANGEPAWRLINGDCVEVLKTIKPGTVRLVFADPPYNIGINYGDHHDDNMDTNDFIEWSESWIAAAAKTLAPDGSMWVLINDEWADVFGCLLRDAGLHRRSWIKWFESFGVNTANNFNRCSRHLFHMVKSPNQFVFHREAVNRPSDRQAKHGDKRADPGGKNWDDVWGINPPIPRLVENSRERIPDFPTQLPLDLLRPVIGVASDPGDLVLDPFNGSGTTGVAAVEKKRKYIGIDSSSKFIKLADLRLKGMQ